MNRYVIPTRTPAPEPAAPVPATPVIQTMPVSPSPAPVPTPPIATPPETISVRSTTTGSYNMPASVVDATGGPHHMLDFVIPCGMPGPAGKDAPALRAACFYTVGSQPLLPGKAVPLTFAGTQNAPGFFLTQNGVLVEEGGFYLADYRVTLAPGCAGAFALHTAQETDAFEGGCCGYGGLCAAQCLVRLAAGDCVSIVRLAQNAALPVQTADSVDGVETATVSLTLLRLFD